MAFSDFPMPADYPPYARHDQVARLLRAYVDHFGFRDTITFDTTVDGRRARRPTAAGRCASPGPTATESASYDAVLVANGHHWDPRWPEPAYPGTFDGEQIHAHDYRSGDQLAGRDVVVVGAGNSAMDIAVEAVLRRAHRRPVAAARPSGCCASSLLGKPERPGRPAGLAAVVGDRARGCGIGATYVRQHDEATACRSPTTSPGSPHPVQSDRIRERLDAGAVTARPAIERLDGDRVVFVDGTAAPADLIVWATGYQVSFPFLDPELVVGARTTTCRCGSAPSTPTCPASTSSACVQADRCGDAARRGAVGVDRRDARRSLRAARRTTSYDARWRAEHRRDKRQFYASPRHTMEVDFDHYLWDLDRERKAGRERAATRTPSLGSGAGPGARRRGSATQLARLLLGAARWKAVGEVPQRGVLVGAPHTSNWDWVLTMLLAWRYGITIRLLVKKELFVGPLGWLLRRTGAVELDRKNPAATIKDCWPRPRAATPGCSGSRRRARVAR